MEALALIPLRSGSNLMLAVCVSRWVILLWTAKWMAREKEWQEKRNGMLPSGGILVNPTPPVALAASSSLIPVHFSQSYLVPSIMLLTHYVALVTYLHCLTHPIVSLSTLSWELCVYSCSSRTLLLCYLLSLSWGSCIQLSPSLFLLILLS